MNMGSQMMINAMQINKALKGVWVYEGVRVRVCCFSAYETCWLEGTGEGPAGSPGLHTTDVSRDKGLISRQIVGGEMVVSVGGQEVGSCHGSWSSGSPFHFWEKVTLCGAPEAPGVSPLPLELLGMDQAWGLLCLSHIFIAVIDPELD